MGEPKNGRRCTAQTKHGRGQCKKAPILGGTVCQKHGGGAPQVKAKAAERLADLIDPDRALREAARLAYADLRELYGADGKLLPVKDWPDQLAAAVGGVKVRKVNLEAGDGQQEDVVDVKLWDKPRALEMLMKHLQLFEDRLKVSGKLEIGWKGE